MLEEENNQAPEEEIEEGEIVEIDVPEEDKDAQDEETVKDEEQDELENYSKGVKKRIATLTKKMREQERAAQSAYDYAKNLQVENENLRTNTSHLSQSYYGEAENRLKSQRAQANTVLKSAYQDQDWDKVTKAQEILDKITVEESKLANNRMQVQRETVYQNVPQQRMQQQVQAPTPQADPEAESWAGKNEWFGQDEIMTLAAFNIHQKLIEEEGFDPSDSMYYDEIDKRMRTEFPHKFSNGGAVKSKARMQQTVAPAGRSDGSRGKRQVRLTKSEVEMARRLNVPVTRIRKAY
jgi:hypothetical protein